MLASMQVLAWNKQFKEVQKQYKKNKDQSYLQQMYYPKKKLQAFPNKGRWASQSRIRTRGKQKCNKSTYFLPSFSLCGHETLDVLS